jgi:aspartyl-tRNA(Asn)/glutamyl-tRNA(Gln) amidotransferase subunit C
MASFAPLHPTVNVEFRGRDPHGIMSISEEQVRHVATLARLGLTDEQIASLGVELNDILVQIDLIQSLDLDGIEPTTHAGSVVNVTRPDVARPCLDQADALLNAPEQQDGAFLIPRFGG